MPAHKIKTDWLKTLCRRGWFLALGPLVLLLFLPAGPVAAQDRLTPAQREIERQRQRLGSSEVEERRDALVRLTNINRLGPPRAPATVLNDAPPMVRATAAHALLSLPSSEA